MSNTTTTTNVNNNNVNEISKHINVLDEFIEKAEKQAAETLDQYLIDSHAESDDLFFALHWLKNSADEDSGNLKSKIKSLLKKAEYSSQTGQFDAYDHNHTVTLREKIEAVHVITKKARTLAKLASDWDNHPESDCNMMVKYLWTICEKGREEIAPEAKEIKIFIQYGDFNDGDKDYTYLYIFDGYSFASRIGWYGNNIVSDEHYDNAESLNYKNEQFLNEVDNKLSKATTMDLRTALHIIDGNNVPVQIEYPEKIDIKEYFKRFEQSN